jgi:hypothetical protein
LSVCMEFGYGTHSVTTILVIATDESYVVELC